MALGSNVHISGKRKCQDVVGVYAEKCPVIPQAAHRTREWSCGQYHLYQSHVA